MKKRSKVTRLRQLTPAQEKRLDVLRRVSGMLDSAMLVPGTKIRFGLDPILGLIPGLGDFVSPLFTIGILWQARDLGIPKIVQLRMIFNVAIDTLVGIVPVAGDLFDVAWKANDMNMALLERHAYAENPASTRDWVFVSAMIALLVVLAVTPFLLLGWVTSLVAGVFN